MINIINMAHDTTFGNVFCQTYAATPLAVIDGKTFKSKNLFNCNVERRALALALVKIPTRSTSDTGVHGCLQTPPLALRLCRLHRKCADTFRFDRPDLEPVAAIALTKERRRYDDLHLVSLANQGLAATGSIQQKNIK